jgi:hypothetical protein
VVASQERRLHLCGGPRFGGGLTSGGSGGSGLKGAQRWWQPRGGPDMERRRWQSWPHEGADREMVVVASRRVGVVVTVLQGPDP